MYQQHINDMAKIAFDKLSGKYCEEEEIREALTEYWSDKIAVIWDTTDIIAAGKRRKKEISEDQAQEILGRMHENHDCNRGITWDYIDDYTDLILGFIEATNNS